MWKAGFVVFLFAVSLTAVCVVTCDQYEYLPDQGEWCLKCKAGTAYSDTRCSTCKSGTYSDGSSTSCTSDTQDEAIVIQVTTGILPIVVGFIVILFFTCMDKDTNTPRNLYPLLIILTFMVIWSALWALAYRLHYIFVLAGVIGCVGICVCLCLLFFN